MIENPDAIVTPPLTCTLLDLFGRIGFISPDTCDDIRGPQGEGIRVNRICCLPFLPQDGFCCGKCRSGGNPCAQGLTCVNGSCVPELPGQICNANYNGGAGVGMPFSPPGTNPNPNDDDGLTFCANPDQGGASPPLCGTLNPYEQTNGQDSVFCCDENLDEYTSGGPSCVNNCPCGDTILGEPCGSIYAPPEDPDILTRFTGQCPVTGCPLQVSYRYSYDNVASLNVELFRDRGTLNFQLVSSDPPDRSGMDSQTFCITDSVSADEVFVLQLRSTPPGR